MKGVNGLTAFYNASLLNIEGNGMIGVPDIVSRFFEALYNANAFVFMVAHASLEFSIFIAITTAQCYDAIIHSIKVSFQNWEMDQYAELVPLWCDPS